MTKQYEEPTGDHSVLWNETASEQLSDLVTFAAPTPRAAYLDLLVRREEWGYMVRQGLIAAVAMLACSSGDARAAGGGIPQAIYENSQAQPQWSQAERVVAGDPVSWAAERLFVSGRQQQANRRPSQSTAGTAVRLK